MRENTHPETTIVFDHAITLSDENVDCIHGARTFTEMWHKHNKGEPFRFFVDQGALSFFLSERGLDLVEHLDVSEMESVYSNGKVTGFFRLAVARPDRNRQDGPR